MIYSQCSFTLPTFGGVREIDESIAKASGLSMPRTNKSRRTVSRQGSNAVPTATRTQPATQVDRVTYQDLKKHSGKVVAIGVRGIVAAADTLEDLVVKVKEAGYKLSDVEVSSTPTG